MRGEKEARKVALLSPNRRPYTAAHGYQGDTLIIA